MCFIFHKWSQWEQYKVHGAQILGRIAPKNVQGREIPYIETRQRRTCLKCNKMQDMSVKDGS